MHLEQGIQRRFQIKKRQITGVRQHQRCARPQDPLDQVAVFDVAVVALREVGPQMIHLRKVKFFLIKGIPHHFLHKNTANEIEETW